MSFGVYLVTRPDGRHTPEDQVLAALHGGANIVQLRDKTASDAEMIALARRLKAAMARFDVPLIINDRIDVAVQSDADGVHVGQSDRGAADVRAAIGPGKLLGLSIETFEQIDAVPVGVVDYLGVGPVMATDTKPDHAAPMGFRGLAEIVRATTLPCVAIGGLSIHDIPAVKAAGSAGLAVVSAIAGADDPEAATAALAKAWGAA